MQVTVTEIITTRSPPPPDGWRAWTIVIGSFFVNFSILGLFYAFGIFLIPLSMEFGVDIGSAALVGTIFNALFYFCGIWVRN